MKLSKLFELPPLYYGAMYFALIPVYALIFYIFSEDLGLNLCGVDPIYLSLVTITTLGFGDITPAKDIGKLIVSSETLLGIGILGLFLNSLSHKRNEELNEAEKQKVLSHKEELRRSLEMHACLILDTFKSGNMFTWDKHAKYSSPMDDLGNLLHGHRPFAK